MRFATFMIEGQVELTGMCNLNLCVQDLKTVVTSLLIQLQLGVNQERELTLHLKEFKQLEVGN